MHTEPLGLQHQGLLAPRLRLITSPLSEYTFPNLYLFRATHAYEVLRDEDIFIRGRSYDNMRFLLPTADVRTLNITYLKTLLQEVDFLFPVPEEWLASFDTAEFDITFVEGDADYMYTVEKMSGYAGRKLHNKRNLLKQFLEAYSSEALPLTTARLKDARFILEDWVNLCGLEPGDTDYGPCREALERCDELALCGGVYYADGEPAGFVLGEELNEETFVLHFAKARTKFKGVYQFMFNNFAKILPPKYKYLNLEQDLDKENLRMFKSSYIPDMLLKKARVSLRR